MTTQPDRAEIRKLINECENATDQYTTVACIANAPLDLRCRLADAIHPERLTPLYAAPQAGAVVWPRTVDELANIIRFCDGDNSRGAGDLAERIFGVLALAHPKPTATAAPAPDKPTEQATK